MSRVGKRPILIPGEVKVTYDDGQVNVKGPKGELGRPIHRDVALRINDGSISVIPSGNRKRASAIQGLTRTIVANMITGVTQGFKRVLEINGVGYRVELKSHVLTFALGYSHPIVYKLPDGIMALVERNKLILSGIDKELLGSAAAIIRSFRPPEPYKGKGIKYAEEIIRRKAGKTGTK